MVFCGRCLEIHPDDAGCISRSCTQHQGGGCSIWEAKVELGGRIDKRSMKYNPSTLQGGEGYPTSSNLYLANREMDKQFNEDRWIRMWAK